MFFLPNEDGKMNPSTLFRRFMRTKLGTLFLLIICIAAGLFIVNFASAAYTKVKSSTNAVNGVDYESHGGRELAGLHGMPNLRKGHHRGGHYPRSQVCRVPKLTLSADANKHAFHKMPPLNCSGEQLFYISNGNLRINQTVLGGQKLQKCEYRAIEWVSDHSYTYSKTYVRDHAPFDIKVKHDFFRVECFLLKKSSNKNKRMQDSDHYRRRLLSALSNEAHGEIVLNNAPRQVGSFGIPDMPDVMLNQHAVERNEMAAKKGLEDLLSKKNLAGALQTESTLAKQPEDSDATETDTEQDAVDNEINEDDDVDDVSILEEKDDNYSTYSDSDSSDFDQFVTQIHVKEEVEERIAEIQPHESSLGINVLIFALDSMSHLSYQRKLPKTYAYLKDVLNTVVLDGYNIVGDATTAAIIPILTGHSELELPETRVNKENSHYVDIYPFLWNKYEQKGYVTLYAEDQPHFGTFQLRLNGFEQPPVDHYMRPFWQAVLDSQLHENSEKFCLGSKPEHKYTLDYLRQFFMRYQKFPKFSFAFIGELSHADNNPAEYIDADLVRFINFLRDQEILDNTLLIVMGDHGARYSSVRGTLQGKLEERLPLMSLAFPQWFQDKYPDLYRNVKRNHMKLTTPFDIHETLRDLIDINRAKLPVHQTDRGISLLKPIPTNRTCESAGVDMHWCTCMQIEEVQITDNRVQRAANKLVGHINGLLSGVREQCEELRLMDIRNASFVFPNEQVLKFQKSIDPDQRIANFTNTYDFDIIHLQVTIETAPNSALYEGTVQIKVQDNSYDIFSDISRINMYGNQSSCVVKSHPDLRKFCYCKK